MNSNFYEFGLGKKFAQSFTVKRPLKSMLALPAYHWSLMAVMAVVLPHLMGLPIWILVLLVISAIMQKPSIKSFVNRITGGRLKLSYRFIQLTMFGVGVLALWISFGRSFGVDVAVGFLVLCLMGKTWELYNKRDAYVVLHLVLFVLAAAFLMGQNLGTMLLGLVALMTALLGFITLSDEGNNDGDGRLRALAMIGLPAVPLLVVLFLFFPRLPPLWSLPMAGKSATTGVSDSMSPGDFSNLSQSTELAFRVEFDGQMPSRQQMYWRGLVFSDFDGVTWRQGDDSTNFWSSRDGVSTPSWAMSAYKGTEHRYRVILEPTEQNWLFALDYPYLYAERGLGMTDNFTLQSYYPISNQRQYQSSYFDDAKIDVYLSQEQKNQNLMLPTDGNDKSKEFAKELYAKTGNPITYIQEVQRFISTEGFSYTLSPPILINNRIDEFLFGTKAGFCEHYASSFAFLMRSAGIPARIVAGYQGGELGRDGKSWEVRQMDAHAWTEVWLEGQGWVRIDPTSFVSPDRVEQGMNAVTQMGGASMFGDGVVAQWSYQQFKTLQALRRYSDQMSYYWQKNVVGYNQDKQQNSLFKWLNISSFAGQFWVLVGSIVGLMAVFVVVVMYGRRVRYHALDLPFIRLSNALAKQDKSMARGASEAYLAWLDRLKNDANADDIDTLKTLYRKYRYGQIPADKQVLAQIKELTGNIKNKVNQ